jgi:hypothetical protein
LDQVVIVAVFDFLTHGDATIGCGGVKIGGVEGFLKTKGNNEGQIDKALALF